MTWTPPTLAQLRLGRSRVCAHEPSICTSIAFSCTYAFRIASLLGRIRYTRVDAERGGVAPCRSSELLLQLSYLRRWMRLIIAARRNKSSQLNTAICSKAISNCAVQSNIWLSLSRSRVESEWTEASLLRRTSCHLSFACFSSPRVQALRTKIALN